MRSPSPASRRPPAPPRVDDDAGYVEASEIGYDLDTPIKTMRGMVHRLNFKRPPGLGELLAFDPTGRVLAAPKGVDDAEMGRAMTAAIQDLTMNPRFIRTVVIRCCEGITGADADTISLSDWLGLGGFVAGFFGPSRATGSA